MTEMGNSIFKALLAILAIFGLVPISNPFNCGSSFKFLFCSVITFLSIFQAVYPIIFYTDFLVGVFSIYTDPHLTKRFILITFVPLMTLCNAVVRLVAICHCTKTVDFMLALRKGLSHGKMAGQQHVKQQDTKLKWTNRVFVWVYILKVLVKVVKMLTDTFSSMNSKYYGVPLHTLPNDAWLNQIADCVASFFITSALYYALGFILLGGIALLNAHEELHQLLYESCTSQQHAFTRLLVIPKDNTLSDIKNPHIPEGSKPIKDAEVGTGQDLFKLFVILKNLFRDYETIAGWYALAIVLSATKVVVNALLFTAFHWENFSSGLGEAALEILALFMLSFFGEHMKGVVRSIKT